MKARGRSHAAPGFTILELLVSMAVLSLLVVAIFGLLSLTSGAYRSSNARLDAFESARSSFDLLTRQLRQAVLHPYWGYDDPENPTRHIMKSDLHFLTGPSADLEVEGGSSHAVFFQAPLGAAESSLLRRNTLLLNSAGFFVQFGEDPLAPPALADALPAKKRFRLNLFLAPREKSTVYDHTLRTEDGVIRGDPAFAATDWFRPDVAAGRYVHAVADNVVAILIRPVDSDGEARSFSWNSRRIGDPRESHRLPDTLDVAMVVIDDPSAERLGEDAGVFPAALFADPARFDGDLLELETHYRTMKPPVDVRIFRATIPLSPSNADI